MKYAVILAFTASLAIAGVTKTNKSNAAANPEDIKAKLQGVPTEELCKKQCGPKDTAGVSICKEYLDFCRRKSPDLDDCLANTLQMKKSDLCHQDIQTKLQGVPTEDLCEEQCGAKDTAGISICKEHLDFCRRKSPDDLNHCLTNMLQIKESDLCYKNKTA